MRTHTRIALVGSLLLAACGSEKTSQRTEAVLFDARSDGGTPGFYFLPPVAPEPGEGTNDAGLAPVVEISALPSGPVLVTFDGDEVKVSGDHYMVLWSTKEHVPVAGTTYRIKVLLDSEELGFADAAVAKNGRELRMLASQDVFGVTGKRTVPIKFRIHQAPAEPEDLDGDGIADDQDLCPTVADPTNLDTDGDGTGDACECLNVECTPAQCEESSACDARTGACVALPKPTGPCDDGNACTESDTCVEGVCTPGAALECTPPSVCQVGACDPAAGCTFTNAPNGTACTLPGDLPGICVAGACTANPG
jgi:hypothetical protein